MRLSDGKITSSEMLDPHKAVKNNRAMLSLIIKYLEKEGKKDDPNWKWEDKIMPYSPNPNSLPLPSSPFILSKDGLTAVYTVGEISYYAAGFFYCTIPYAEAIPLLSDEVKSFLPESLVTEAMAAAEAEAKVMEGLTEDLMSSMIIKANSRDISVLSSEFKSLFVKYKEQHNHPNDHPDYDLTVFKYPFNDVERCMITNPEVKIMEYYPENGRNIVRVVFDVRDRDWDGVYWCSQNNFESQLFAADFIKESGKWVIDDVFTERNGYGNPIQVFDIQSAQSFKKGVRYLVENFNAAEYAEWMDSDDWDI